MLCYAMQGMLGVCLLCTRTLVGVSDAPSGMHLQQSEVVMLCYAMAMLWL
jgi:hypothetical protein